MKTVICLLSLLLTAALATGADFSVKVGAKGAPKELAAPMSALLDPNAVQLREGDKPVYDFWFVKQLPLKSIPESVAVGLKTIPEASVLGAVVVHQPRHDYKNNDIAPGIYTMRFALQPQDGDHLGTALYPYFAVLIPAKLDPTPEGINAYRPLVKASGKETATGHPIILSLRPLAKIADDLPKLNEPQPEHRSIQLKISGKAPDAEEASPLPFELVYEGHGEIQ